MTPKLTSAAEDAPIRVVIVTLDNHLSGAVGRARKTLAAELPGLELSLHAASDWSDDALSLSRCQRAVGDADIIVASMLFAEDHVRAIEPALAERRDACDALVGLVSAPEITKLTRLGGLDMGDAQSGPMALLKKLKPQRAAKPSATAGERQMAMLRRLPKILKFIPGAAQDLRAYFLAMQYWLAGSDENVADLVRFLVQRYADGPRQGLRSRAASKGPRDYPDVGLYHPALPGRITDDAALLPRRPDARGRVGLVILRAYALAGDAGHYDGVISALEERGLDVVPAFASGLDARPAIERFFIENDRPSIDALVSLTGFSLVGGPAYNDAAAAQATLSRLDVPYLAAQALEFQTLSRWAGDDRGLSPLEQTIMIAIPELEGATNPIVFGGRDDAVAPCSGCERACPPAPDASARAMRACPERAQALAARVDKLVALRKTPTSRRKVAIVLFNFPPNGGAVGTAAHLDVFASLHNVLRAMRTAGYDLDPPESPDALRQAVTGEAERYGTDANVLARIDVDDHVRRERWLGEIERQWGPAPGRQLATGAEILIQGARFGSVLVGVQPGFGYEGDPMRLLFEKGFAPTHAFSAFYRYLREDFGADAILHFGTHGALEFMPGKQSALGPGCWPDRLIGAVPNVNLYAANNPSEGMIAKRRAAAVLVSHLTPPLERAGLHSGFKDLTLTIERRRAEIDPARRDDLAAAIQVQAAELDFVDAAPLWSTHEAETNIERLRAKLREIEAAFIPHGLHVIGDAPSRSERADYLAAIADAAGLGEPLGRELAERLARGATKRDVLTAFPGVDPIAVDTLFKASAALSEDHELPALIRALDGRYIAPVAGGDVAAAPDILPTGRNLHGFDPFKIPSAYAVKDGARLAERLLDRHRADGHANPETVALVLWGADNLKSEGAPIAQALALMGAAPRFDAYGRLTGARLIPLEELGRPRIDVVCTLSGIFRDLLPMQTKLLAEAAYLAASAAEPVERNFIRKHALALQAARGCDLEAASLRVFSNADGAYGSNVNHMLDTGLWSDEDELADVFEARKSFAYGRSGRPQARGDLLQAALATVDLAYQNLESVELGVTTIDHYFDTLGGVGRAVRRARGVETPIYICDQTQGDAKVRALAEQVTLETRTRMLNPHWYEAMLRHGYEGVRQIEAHVTNTMGWSATTGQVEPWIYQRLAETFVLDEALREQLASLNPKSSARLANRLIEASDRRYWTPDEATLNKLHQAGRDLEDRVEGVGASAAA